MFTRVKNFFSRHKRKFIVGGVLVGGAVLAMRYAQRKLLEWQEKEVKALLDKSKKEHHFRSTERTCSQTIISLSETLKEAVLKLVDTEEVLAKIKEGDDNKVALWDNLKILVFTQLASLLYSSLMLVILMRIQLNVMGGYLIREKPDELPDQAFSMKFQEHYLSMGQHFLTVGIKDLCTIIEKHVRLVFKGVSLKQKISLQDIEQLFWGLQASLMNDELDPLKNLSKYLIPPSNTLNFEIEGSGAKLMKKVMDETYEILDCHDVKSTVDSCIKQAFSNSVDQIATYYVPEKPPNGTSATLIPVKASTSKEPTENPLINVTKITVPMAKLVPIIHGLLRTTTNNGTVDPWIQQFLVMDKINTLGKYLYEAFSIEQVSS